MLLPLPVSVWPLFSDKAFSVFFVFVFFFATEDERSGCYSQIVLILSCGCLCSASRPRGAVGWSVLCLSAFPCNTRLYMFLVYSKPCLKRLLSKGLKFGFQDLISLNAGQKYCRMQQYFRPLLSYQLSLRSLFLYIFE